MERHESKFSAPGGTKEDSLDYKGRRACRVCDDFKSWRKTKTSNDQQQSKSNTNAPTNENPIASRHDCPADVEELGRNTWSFLHTMAAYYPETPKPIQQTNMTKFIDLFAKFYPCEHCASDFQESKKTSPPDVKNRYTLSDWFCQQHNIVNRKLGKKEFDCSKVLERWRDGWKDGSCD